MLVSIIIPVYNSNKSLPIISEQVSELFSHRKEDYELIFVNDSPSNKNTCETLLKLKQRNPEKIHILEMYKNRGQQFALLCGMKKSKGSYVITMDDDLQHPVSEIAKLIDAMNNEKSLDMISGIAEKNERKHNLFRNFGSWFINRISDLYMDKPKKFIGSSFKIAKRSVIDFIIHNYNATPNMTILYLNGSERVKNIFVEHNPREYGKSGYTLRKLISLSFNNMVRASSFPLQILGVIGIIVFSVSLLLIFYIFFARLSGNIGVPGYASTMIVVMFFGGINLLGIGIIGEYLIRIIKELNKPKLEDLFEEK